MSKAIHSEIVFDSTATEPTGISGLTYMDDGTNTGGPDNILRVYDGTNFNNVQRIPETVILSDQKTLGQDGGSITAGVDTTRVLNTVSTARDWLSLSSNIFTIDGANYPGNYYIEWFCPGYLCFNFVCWLEDDGSSTVLQLGQSTYSSLDSQTLSHGFYYTNITTSIDLKIVMRCSTTKATNGLGVNKGGALQGNEIYTNVKIIRY